MDYFARIMELLKNLNVIVSMSENAGRHIGGIAASNRGNIINCNVDIDCNVRLSADGTYSLKLGGITGVNYGKIEQCIVIGSITTSGGSFSCSGGITGENSGELIKCKNYSNINGSTERSGGIAGNMESIGRGTIKQCINFGDIGGSIYGGGIAGYIGSNYKIEECANKGNYRSLINSAKIGGICGRAEDNSEMKNCYVSGDGNGNGTVCGIVREQVYHVIIDRCYVRGQLPRYSHVVTWTNEVKEEITNCYYDSTVYTFEPYTLDQHEYNAIGKTTAEMKDASFISLLGDKFKADSNNINNGYPILAFE